MGFTSDKMSAILSLTNADTVAPRTRESAGIARRREMGERVLTFEAAYRLADERSDAGDQEASELLNYCAASAEFFQRIISKLAYAALEKNAAKRREIVASVKSELDRGDYDVFMPLFLGQVRAA
jgi:hypothetical protein